jgi:hypothetical protein
MGCTSSINDLNWTQFLDIVRREIKASDADMVNTISPISSGISRLPSRQYWFLHLVIGSVPQHLFLALRSKSCGYTFMASQKTIDATPFIDFAVVELYWGTEY